MAVSIQAGWLNSMQSVQNQSAEQGGADRAAGSKQIFAGSLKMPLDPVAQRRQQAREQAWNLVRNAWNSDKDTDKSVQDRMDHYTKMQQLQEEAKAAADDGNDDKKVLQQLYGVAPDSQEQKDLELLEREMNANNGLGDGDFSEEESQRLSELHSGTLTEYQQRALELHKRVVHFEKEARDAGSQMRGDMAAIHSIGIERLKHNPMLEAQQAADSVMKAANGDIYGMLIQEGVDHIDEKTEEAEEKAEESVEEKEENEEKLEELKIRRAIQRAVTEGTKEAVEEAKEEAERSDAPDMDVSEGTEFVKGNSAAEDVGQSLEEIRNSMNLLEADLKGIKVDQEI